MSTQYYLAKNNDFNGILVTDGNRYAWFDTDSQGRDITSGVDLYASNAHGLVALAYSRIYLYTMDDIARDMPHVLTEKPDDCVIELVATVG